MKVHYRSPRGGVVVENPRDLQAFAASSPRGGATVVLHGDILLASDISCSSHSDTLEWAGLEEDYFDPYADDPEGKSLRMAADAKGLTCEIWARDDIDADPAVFPFEMEKMERLYRYVVEHPRMRVLAGRQDFDIEIQIWDCEQSARWKYDGNGLHQLIQPEAASIMVPMG